MKSDYGDSVIISRVDRSGSRSIRVATREPLVPWQARGFYVLEIVHKYVYSFYGVKSVFNERLFRNIDKRKP